MKISNYLKKHKLTGHKFAKLIGVEWSCFYRGHNSPNISLWLAKKIVDGSNGEITFNDFKMKKMASNRRRVK